MKIEAKNLTKEYVQGEKIIKALNNVNFTIAKGDFIGITGRSGSGKTTMLNIMAGLTVPTSGSVILHKSEHRRNILELSDTEQSLYRNTVIGCLPQVSSVLANLTVLDNVRLPFYLAKRSKEALDSENEARRLLKEVGIEDLAERLPKRLSGGQLKRVAIARALINNPDFLFVDEPTGDLDEQTTGEIMKIFKNAANNGTAVLMVTHELDTTKYADKHFVMRDGVLWI